MQREWLSFVAVSDDRWGIADAIPRAGDVMQILLQEDGGPSVAWPAL